MVVGFIINVIGFLSLPSLGSKVTRLALGPGLVEVIGPTQPNIDNDYFVGTFGRKEVSAGHPSGVIYISNLVRIHSQTIGSLWKL